ncbi:MAG TPA: DUF3540 domain-containing protein [Polyangiales bacterium]
MDDLRVTLPNAFVPPRINAIDAPDELGRVIRVSGERVVIRTRSRDRCATLARSCLVEPQCDDLVLCTSLDDGRCYILAILEREEPALCLRLGEGAALSFREGEVCLRARAGIRLVSDDVVGVIARSIHVMATEGTLLIKSLSFLSECIHLDAARLRMIADLVESTAKRRVRRAAA